MLSVWCNKWAEFDSAKCWAVSLVSAHSPTGSVSKYRHMPHGSMLCPGPKYMQHCAG